MDRFLLIFKDTKNEHLTKDVGMIPYLLHKKYKFDSEILTLKNGDYPALNEIVRGLKLKFLKKHRFSLLNYYEIIKYLIQNSKNIDYLQVYHFNRKNAIYLIIYKLLNKNGIFYIKGDVNKRTICNKKPFFQIILKFLLRYSDLISVETNYVYSKLRKYRNVVLLPNGILFKNKNFSVKNKKNIVLAVNRLFGDPDKNSEMLFPIILKTHFELPDWKFELVGPQTEAFKKKIKHFFFKYPFMKNRVRFTGPIYDREKLCEKYKLSKIFILTSTSESFGLAAFEAGYFGNIVITTDITSANEMTKAGYFSKIISPNDVDTFAREIIRIAQSKDLNKKAKEISQYIRDRFDWDKVIRRLYSKLNLKLNRASV